MRSRLRLFLPLFLVLLLADCTTKELAETHLGAPYVPHEVVGDLVRLTLAYNPGAAFSLSLGAWSRPGFIVLTLGILVVLGQMLARSAPEGRLRILALALIMGGAVGNLLDRLTSSLGVVDFIDIGIGAVRFWTFNLADVWVTTGAILLAWTIWQEDIERENQLRGVH